jgi:hypothetical protein
MESSGVSIVISQHHQTDLLRYVLLGIAAQVFRPGLMPDACQIIIADDRSTPEERDAIQVIVDNAVKQHFSNLGIEVVISKYDGPDFEGWAKGAALNKAVREHARHDLLLFLDGDCVPCHSWLQSHYKAQHDHGIHYYYDPGIPGIAKFHPGLGERSYYIGSRFFILDRHVEKSKILIESGDLRSLYLFTRGIVLWCSVSQSGEGIAKIQGCNFSIFRPWFLEVGGFKEGKEGKKRLDDAVLYNDLFMVGIVPRPNTDAAVYHMGEQYYYDWGFEHDKTPEDYSDEEIRAIVARS